MTTTVECDCCDGKVAPGEMFVHPISTSVGTERWCKECVRDILAGPDEDGEELCKNCGLFKKPSEMFTYPLFTTNDLQEEETCKRCVWAMLKDGCNDE